MNRLLLSEASDEEKLKGIEELSDFHNFNLLAEQKDSLNEVVGQIRKALKTSIESKTDMATRTELAHDELNRLRMDNDKLYISNSVLDNCLSSLKHETMYYPSRIRQADRQSGKESQCHQGSSGLLSRPLSDTFRASYKTNIATTH